MITTKTKISHYEVIRHLSEGGFGTTYLVRDTHIHPPAENRRIIKQLKPIEDDPKIYELIKERFKQEAKTIETLGKGHSQIPVLYGYFEEARNFYLVEEYIEGKTLDQLIEEKGTLEDTEVKGILENLVKVLDYLQENRVIHRDIKPENIILRESDGKPVLIDFGTMKQSMGTSLTTSGNNTRSIVIGTPGFMPPEQMIGRPVFASDIYALGLTGIYLLTGKRPEELETDPETGQILWEKETSNVSGELAQILNKAIASQAKERFTKAKLLAEALVNPQADIPASGTNKIYAPTYIQSPTPAELGNADHPQNNKKIYAPTYIQTPNPAELGNADHPQNNLIAQVSQVMSHMNPSQKTFAVISLIVAVIGVVATVTNATLNVMDRIEDKKGEQITRIPIPEPSPTPSPTIIDPDAEAERLKKEKERLEEIKRLQEEKERLEREIANSNRQPTYTPPKPTSKWKSSCGSPRGSGSVWYAVVGDRNALSKVKGQHCGDALITGGVTQAASFTSYSQAQNFAQHLSRETGYNFWVKEPKTVNNFTPPPVSYASPSLSYRYSCGDPFVAGATWYAVVGSRSSLDMVKRNYCGDAIVNRSGNTQVASFTSNSRAQQFASQLENASGRDFWVKKQD